MVQVRGLTVEKHINRLGQDLIPLAERVMREALGALEATRGAPSQVVEGGQAMAIAPTARAVEGTTRGRRQRNPRAPA